MKIGIVVSDFNSELTAEMLDTAQDYCKELNIKVGKIIHVLGAFDMPLAVKRLLDISDIDAVTALGVILQGDTEHDRIIGYSTAAKLQDLALIHEKPVSLGIIGPRVKYKQAKKRTIEYAKRAVDAVVKLKKELEKLKKELE